MPEKPIKVVSNFKMKSSQISKYARRLNKKFFRGAMFSALEEVGNVAAQDYMKSTSLAEAVASPSSGSILTTRSGRLVGSVVGTWRFSQASLPVKVEKGMRKKVRQTQAGFEGGKKESIRKVMATGSKIEGIIGSKVPYAAIHEYGGKTTPTTSYKARSYFWWAYFETGDEKWKAMALSRKSRFSRDIKERPYLRPAVKTAWPSIMNIFKRTAETTFEDEHV